MVRFGGSTVGAALAPLVGLGSQLSAQVTAELDAFWQEVSGSVESGDFERYPATYHPDAGVIFGETTQPIATALAGWESGFEDTRRVCILSQTAPPFAPTRR